MSRMSSVACLLFAAGLSLLGALGNETLAQETKGGTPEPVKLLTVDGVKLNGLFYPSAKKDAATVIMLHPVGEGKSTKLDGWKNLAETLQKKDFAVLMFDFRGHGGSTTIDTPEDFWTKPANRNLVRKSSKEGDSIEVKDFIKQSAYFPVLINDIAAAKAFLERKNDSGGCNVANTIVIGAENGATLGAIWINSEWYRYKATINMFNQPQVEKRAEGNDVIAGVWLNIKPELGTRKVSVGNILKEACRAHAMPCVFFYGEKDSGAKIYTKTLVDFLKVKGSKKHELIGPVQMPDTNLSGVKLLGKDTLKTEEAIATYLSENVLSERNNEWSTREFQNSIYMWRNPLGGSVPQFAKTKTEKNLKFDTYEKFMQ